MKTRYYLGHGKGFKKVFSLDHVPTPKEFPDMFAFVGPFITKRAALWAASQYNNPHYQHVRDAERLSKINF
jgi:hypothetical protein